MLCKPMWMFSIASFVLCRNFTISLKIISFTIYAIVWENCKTVQSFSETEEEKYILKKGEKRRLSKTKLQMDLDEKKRDRRPNLYKVFSDALPWPIVEPCRAPSPEIVSDWSGTAGKDRKSDQRTLHCYSWECRTKRESWSQWLVYLRRVCSSWDWICSNTACRLTFWGQ